MKRQINGLRDADRCAVGQIPDGVFRVRVQGAKFQRQAQKPYYTVTLSILEPIAFRRAGNFEPHLLHSESPVEAQLVSAGLWL